MVVGDGGCEAYTAIVWGGLLSRVRHNLAEAEAVDTAEGNMCGAAMRGADALPWSKTPSRTKGMRRNLGGLTPDHRPYGRPGSHREGEEPKPMMHGREKSDPAVVAMKRANKAERSAAESVEPRAGAEGNASQQSTRRAQNRKSVSHALESIRQANTGLPSSTRGGSRMRESRLYGSVRGALSNGRPYRERPRRSAILPAISIT